MSYWYFKTSPETWGFLPANRQLVGLYMDWRTEYHIWKFPTTTTIDMGMMGYLHDTYEEAKEGVAYLGPTRDKPNPVRTE